MEGLVRIALRTARQQAPQLIQAHDRPPISRFSTKGLQEYVHQLRTRLSATFKETVNAHFPDHRISTEAIDISEQSGYWWYVEPLCGEENFLRSLPDYCALIGIFHNNSLQHAAVFHYLEDEEFYATKNEGAAVNQSRLRVSSTSSLSRAVIAYTTQISGPKNVQFQEAMQAQVFSSRCSGCVALDLARVAQGKFDASICLGTNRLLPSIASLLVTEAGGLATPASQTSEYSLAGNPQVFTALESKLSTAHQEPIRTRNS